MKHTDLDFKFEANDVRCWYQHGELLLNFNDVQEMLFQRNQGKVGLSLMRFVPKKHEDYVSVNAFHVMCRHVRDDNFFRDIILAVIDALAESIVMEVAK